MTMEYVITYLFILINMLTCIFSYKVITQEKLNINQKNIIVFFIFGFVTLILRKFNYIYINLIFNFLSIAYLLKYCYKINNKKSLYYTLVILFISLFCDAAVPTIIDNAYLMNNIEFKNNFYFRSLLTIPVCIVYLGLVSIPLLKKLINFLFYKLISKNISKLFLLILGLITNVILLFFCINGYKQVNRNGHLLIYIAIILFSIMLILIIYLIYKEYQINSLNRNIVAENKYMKDIARKDKEFKHNLINNLLGIKTVASKKVNQLIDELISEYKTDYKNILNINDLPDGILSIIYRKAYEENIENLNLAVDNKIKKDLVDMLLPKNYNKFCTSIGILFDNALDAVKSCKEKVIEINFLEDDEYVYYIQKNSFTNVIDLEQTGTKEYTTKKSGHGIGLNYVKNLKDIETKNEVINNMFITKLKIKKIKM